VNKLPLLAQIGVQRLTATVWRGVSAGFTELLLDGKAEETTNPLRFALQ
jgi:hypothetical protein